MGWMLRLLTGASLVGEATKTEKARGGPYLRKCMTGANGCVTPLILFIQTLALYKSFSYLVTYLRMLHLLYLLHAVSTARGSRPWPTSLKEAVVTAVQADQSDKECRAKTVAVSGLIQRNATTDIDSFRRLSMLELGVDWL